MNRGGGIKEKIDKIEAKFKREHLSLALSTNTWENRDEIIEQNPPPKQITPEDQQKLEEHSQEIVAILYRNAEAKNIEQLKTLEGIELAVREQMLENVSPKIGIFLSSQAMAQKQENRDI